MAVSSEPQLGELKFRRQHNIGQYIADFYCHQVGLVVEVDGEIHRIQAERDVDRDQWMTSNGFSVLRFSNDEIFNGLPTVLAKILQAANP